MSLNAKKVKEGDVVSFTYYCQVQKVGKEEIAVKDLERNNNIFLVKGSSLIETGASADQFSKTVSCTKTELASKLIEVGHLPFQVCFIKSDKTQRILRGKYLSHEKLLGRSKVMDLDLKTNPLRLIDHRNLLWLVVDNIKYVLKK